METNELVRIVVAAVVAGGLGALGPAVVRRLPEPQPHPDDLDDDPKVPYAVVAASRRALPGVAVLAAALGALAAWALPGAGQPGAGLLPAWVLFAGVGSWLAWVDWRTRLLPFLVTAPLHLAVLLLVVGAAAWIGDWSLLWRGLAGNVVVFTVFWLIWFLGRRVGTTFGYGDVRLSAILGLLLGPLGPTTTLAGTYAGFLLGAVLGVVLSRLGVVDRRAFAFGPYMVLGAFVGLAVAPVL